DTAGLIDEHNLVLSVTHNHSSPSYSSFDWGVWTFQDVFDFRFFDYYARQNAKAVEDALANLHDVRVSGTVSRFDAFQRNPMGPGWADDGTPDGFPRPYTDHDLSVVRFENVDDPHHPRPLATLANIGQHPEMLMGYDLISGEWPATTERLVDRTVGGTTVITQNATGTSEVERDLWHAVHDFEALGVPIPENYSAPSTTGLEDTVGVHMQAFRLGDILFTVCSCEQWVEQAYNIKTRTDQLTGNEYLGYDATAPDADPSLRC